MIVKFTSPSDSSSNRKKAVAEIRNPQSQTVVTKAAFVTDKSKQRAMRLSTHVPMGAFRARKVQEAFSDSSAESRLHIVPALSRNSKTVIVIDDDTKPNREAAVFVAFED